MPNLTLSRDELIAFDPCAQDQRLKLFGRRKRMDARQALAAGATISGLLWVAGRLGRKDLCVRFALACAQRTAHLNTDPRVQAAIDAAQKWVDDPSEANRQANAAAAAYAAAAAAANAAYAAAYAADAANAANAADAAAAADAANAAAAAADAANAEREAQRVIFLEIFAPEG